MTTPQEAVAKGEELADVIARTEWGFTAEVPEVWCTAPNDRIGLCGTTGQHHCAASVARVWYEVGLRPGQDFPWPFCYCPNIALWSDQQGYTVDTPQIGDAILIDWEGDGEQDHCELVIGADNWPASVTTRGWNTDGSGHGLVYERPASLISRIVRPRWPDQPTTTSAAAPSRSGLSPAVQAAAILTLT